MQRLPFSPEGAFHWGPSPGKFLYTSIYIEVIGRLFPARFPGNRWSETLYLFQSGKMLWLNDHRDLQVAGQHTFLELMRSKEQRGQLYKEWQGTLVPLKELWKGINELGIQALTNEELKNLWLTFHTLYTEFWVTCIAPELGNYGSSEYLTKILQPLLPSDTLASAVQILTAPTRLSFYKEEEIALAQTDDLNAHQVQYFWLQNSYAGTKVLPVEFFSERKVKLSPAIVEETRQHQQEAQERKVQLQRQYGLSKEIVEIGEAISDCIAWQDERKKYIFIALHYQDVLLREIGNRLGYTNEELHDAWYLEIPSLFENDLHERLRERQIGFGVLFYDTCRELNATDVSAYWRVYDEPIVTIPSEVKGVTVCHGSRGTVCGRVRLIPDPSQIGQFASGDILLAPMTSPEYIFVMRHAGAIITDAGGLTSHAAIVSRELNIPCIVGTKIATKILKDGDLVEVDAEKGIVRKIS